VGIPEDIRDTLFRPFGSKKPGGSGFGLPSCRRVVMAHGGKITFESEVGGGTTFTVALPKKAETS
jgi:signal transduction histidine kinase